MQLNEITNAIKNILSNNEWHDFSEFLPLASDISGEVCDRVYVSNRRKNERDNLYELSTRINLGRKRIIDKRLSDLVRRGKIQREGSGFNAKYRNIKHDN